jgi:hypothetical protein
MTPTILRPIETLRHCSDIFLKAGQESAAHFANRMADDAADLNAWKPGLGDALYRTWTAQMVERAERINRSKL